MIFSIIICTYNPEEKLLNRVLDALLLLTGEGLLYECIIVDNNSQLPLTELKAIKRLKGDSRFKIISETKPGLTNARIAGAKNSIGEVLVFVDDDNELESQYLLQLNNLLKTYPLVAAWGPGKIRVEYTDGAAAWIKKYFAAHFQEKDLAYTQYGCVAGWPDYFPAGSGLVVKREVFNSYINLYENGTLTSADRKGNDLSSAGDSQIVWAAIKMGLAAGTSPNLKLNHLISSKKTNRAYLAKLSYGVSNSYYKALKEAFPQAPMPFAKSRLVTRISLIIKTFLQAKANPLLFYRLYTIKSAWTKGYDDTL